MNKVHFLYLFIYLFIYLAALGLCCCARAFSSCGEPGLLFVVVSGGYSSLQCLRFSLRWLLLLWSTGSRRAGFSSCGTRAFSSCGSRALERRLSSCGTRASLLRGMWDLPGAGLEPVSPALAGGFLTTAPPGKSSTSFLMPFLAFNLSFHVAPITGLCTP